jgi:hypothetical protein
MTDFKTTNDPFATGAKVVGWMVIFFAVTGLLTIIHIIGRAIWGG